MPVDADARVAVTVGACVAVPEDTEQVASALDLIVHVERLRDGSRRISHVTEVVGMEGDVITLGEHSLTFCTEEGEEEAAEPEGTRVFSVRELSDINTKPAIDPAELQRQNRVLAILSKAASELVPIVSSLLPAAARGGRDFPTA